MKLILSKSGGGKTTKVVTLMADLLRKGEKSMIISDDVGFNDFQWVAVRENIDLTKIVYKHADNLETIVKAIEDDKQCKTVFIDLCVPIFAFGKTHNETSKHAFDLLSKLEKASEKKLYITIQTNIDQSQPNEKTLIVLEYEPEHPGEISNK